MIEEMKKQNEILENNLKSQAQALTRIADALEQQRTFDMEKYRLQMKLELQYLENQNKAYRPLNQFVPLEDITTKFAKSKNILNFENKNLEEKVVKKPKNKSSFSRKILDNYLESLITDADII